MAVDFAQALDRLGVEAVHTVRAEDAPAHARRLQRKLDGMGVDALVYVEWDATEDDATVLICVPIDLDVEELIVAAEADDAGPTAPHALGGEE